MPSRPSSWPPPSRCWRSPTPASPPAETSLHRGAEGPVHRPRGLARVRAMRVLVSGGAGYIGSHTVVQLVAAGHEVLIVDNFGNSKPTVVNRLEALTGTHLEVHSFDLRDHDKTEHLFANEKIDAVIHFAGLKAVGESVELPLEYYENNLVSTFSLVRAMR